MIEWITARLFEVLLIAPFAALFTTLFFVRLTADEVRPPVLLVLLTIREAVTLVAAGYIAALTVNSRFLNNTNPPELLPVTLFMVDALLVTGPVIAFVLWRSRRR